MIMMAAEADVTFEEAAIASLLKLDSAEFEKNKGLNLACAGSFFFFLNRVSELPAQGVPQAAQELFLRKKQLSRPEEDVERESAAQPTDRADYADSVGLNQNRAERGHE
ncbi:MAG: hypothetical protein Kow00107_07100 [Planctomycetota bacterium]